MSGAAYAVRGCGHGDGIGAGRSASTVIGEGRRSSCAGTTGDGGESYPEDGKRKPERKAWISVPREAEALFGD
jgi:hypothetical protein